VQRHRAAGAGLTLAPGAAGVYPRLVTEFLEAVLNIGAVVGLVVLVMWVASLFVGPKAFGLPVMIAVFVAVAIPVVISNSGFGVGVVAIGGGVLAVIVVFGLAMTGGPEKPPISKPESPEDRGRG
jgi:hypothetical protein